MARIRESRAHRKGRELRHKLRLRERVDAEAVANILGYPVLEWPIHVLGEMAGDGVIIVSPLLNPCERRWKIAHSIAHHQLHSGNQLWKSLHTDLAALGERQAEDYAAGLLIDVDEAIEELLTGAPEAAEYFGVPPEKIAIQQRLGIL